VRSTLPLDAESPVVDIQRTDKPYATFYVSFTSDTLSLTQLNEFLIRQIQPELQTIPGVQRCGIEGSRELAMRIWLIPDRMDALNVTPTGRLDRAPEEQLRRRRGPHQGRGHPGGPPRRHRPAYPQQFEQLIVTQNEGAFVRLKDVAKVELG